MRILHVLGGLNRGGAETWLVQILRHIDRSKYQFDFLVHTDQRCAYDDEVRALGADIISCPRPTNPLRYTRSLLQILREHGPYDCVHSHVHRFSGYVLTMARLAGVHSRIAHSHLSDTQNLNRRQLYHAAMANLLRLNATTGLAVSEKAATSLFGENWKSNPRWRISHLGVDLQPFCDAVDRRQLRAELGIPEHAFVVGHVGRFCEQKNHTFLLDIAERVCAIKTGAIFLLIGDGPLRKDMEAKAEALGISQQVRFIGLRDDVVRLMTGAMDVFLLPSLYEGFPMVLIEAQAAGLRCFLADTIAPETDILSHLVTRLSLHDAASTWAHSITEERLPADRTPQADAMQHFSIDAAVSRLCSVYDES